MIEAFITIFSALAGAAALKSGYRLAQGERRTRRSGLYLSWLSADLSMHGDDAADSRIRHPGTQSGELDRGDHGRPGSMFWTQYRRGLVGRSVGALRAARGLYTDRCRTDVDAEEKLTQRKVGRLVRMHALAIAIVP